MQDLPMVSPAFQFLPAKTWLYSYCGTINDIQNSRVKICTSSRELTANPWAFITGRTWAANARRSWRASSCCSGLVGSAVIKFMWWFGLDSAWFSRTWTIVGVVLSQIKTWMLIVLSLQQLLWQSSSSVPLWQKCYNWWQEAESLFLSRLYA